MDSVGLCDEVRPLLAELAAGAAAGYDRARAVRHVATCPSCSRELAELAKVADGLLLLAPPTEPPAGFVSAVVTRMTATGEPALTPRPRARAGGGWLRRRTPALVAAVLAAVLAAGAAGAGVTYQQHAADRQLADRYRQILAVADGRYLRALRLTTDTDAPAGTVFLYQGRPSWVLASVTSAPGDGRYDMVIVDRDGRSHQVGVCRVAQGSGTTGYELALPVADVAVVALHGPGGVRLSARVE
jgi:hypothetical protein